jgi:hypothetical protein
MCCSCRSRLIRLPVSFPIPCFPLCIRSTYVRRVTGLSVWPEFPLYCTAKLPKIPVFFGLLAGVFLSTTFSFFHSFVTLPTARFRCGSRSTNNAIKMQLTSTTTRSNNQVNPKQQLSVRCEIARIHTVISMANVKSMKSYASSTGRHGLPGTDLYSKCCLNDGSLY